MKRIIVLAIIMIVSGQSWAHAQLYLEQGKMNHQISAGETVNQVVTVKNTSDREVTVKAYWEDFAYQPPFDGTKKFSPAGTGERSLAGWVSFSPQEFTIAPFGKKDINYVINAPADATGGYYGVLFVENADQSQVTNTGVRIITRVGCLFFVETINSDRQGVFDVNGFDQNRLQGEFRNNGNVVLIPKGVFYVLNEDNVVADRGEVANLYLPSGATAPVEMVLAKGLDDGRYMAVVTFTLEGQDDVVVKEIDFEKSGDSFDIISARD